MLTRRRVLTMLSMGAMTLVALTGCQPQAAAPTPTSPSPLLKPQAAKGADLTPVLASSELATGRNRFGLGLIDSRNQAITAGDVQLEFFKLTKSGTAEKRGDAKAVFRAVQIQSKGFWVAQTSFDDVGQWGVQVMLSKTGEPTRSARLNFEVLPHFSAPGYGDPAPRSASPTLRDVGGDATRVCTNQPPCDLHELSIADALIPAQKPLVVLFATPALCTSAICAPELSAVQQLRASGGYADRANFVHVEIYEYPFQEQKPSHTVDEWRLPSEPWVFLVDRAGLVQDRFEGSAPVEELEPALMALL